ncbi:MAG: 4Fe-4S binding protein [Chloroflexi bacterium]|nr:4Fe-4S binding protein [Chloroflexota bacterium]
MVAKEESIKFVRSFDEVIQEVLKRNYRYVWRPEYIDDLAEGPRCCAGQGVPASMGADLVMKEFEIRIDQHNCTQCGICWVFCPLGVIYQDEEGNFIIDEDYCRACGVCVEECPTQAVEMTKIKR